MKRRLIVLTLIVLTLMSPLLIASPALAIADPTSGPTIERVDIYRHCLETWDMLIVVQYYLNYDANPDETINQAYLGRFMSATDTELVNVAPYAYYDKGYDHGVFSMYLDASYNAHWGTACSVRFEGNPTLDWSGDPPSIATTTFNWHTLDTIEATKPLLSANTISIANSLSDYWSVALTEETAAGTKLSPYGEQYFTNAIPNIRTMIPAIFAGAIKPPVYEPDTYEQSGRDLYLSRLDGTTIGIGLQGLADWTSVPLTVVKAVMWLFLISVIGYIIAIRARDLRIALFSILVMIPCGTLVGMLSLTFTVIAALLCGIALAYSVFYQRASG